MDEDKLDEAVGEVIGAIDEYGDADKMTKEEYVEFLNRLASEIETLKAAAG